MAKGSSKKPGDPKCRACGGLLEGRAVVRIGGNKWHSECAEKQSKFIPVEYREGYVKKARPEAEAPAQPETETAETPDEVETVEEAAAAAE